MIEDECFFFSEWGLVLEFEFVEWEFEGFNIQECMFVEWCCFFLWVFVFCGIVLDGCCVVGVFCGVVEYWREIFEWFNMMFEIVCEEVVDCIEVEVFCCVVDGYDELVIYQGMMIMVIDKVIGEEKQLVVRKYSDVLMQILLKGVCFDKYCENYKVEYIGVVGGVLVILVVIDKDIWVQEVQWQQVKYVGNNEGGDVFLFVG